MREMGIVYWCHTIGGIAISLVSIFIPIYLLKTGYTFTTVLYYILMQQVLAALLQFPVSTLFRFFRPHTIMALGSLAYVVLFGLLSTLNHYHWPLLLLALAWALNRSLYWLGFHYTFSLSRGHHNAGQQIAGINALAIVGSTVAPAIGGIIASLFGITYIYVAAMALLLIAITPLFTPNGPEKTKVHFDFQQLQLMRRDMLANLFNGTVLMTEQYFWPLFIFFIISSYAGIGMLSSVIALTSIAMTLYVGKHQAVKGDKYFLRRGTAAYSLASIGRAIAQSTTQVFGLNVLGGIGRSLYVTPFINRYYTNSDTPYRLGYIAAMESAFSVGAAVFTCFILLLSLFMPDSAALSAGLLVVAFSAWGVRLIR
jgi:hypothetical protein